MDDVQGLEGRGRVRSYSKFIRKGEVLTHMRTAQFSRRNLPLTSHTTPPHQIRPPDDEGNEAVVAGWMTIEVRGSQLGFLSLREATVSPSSRPRKEERSWRRANICRPDLIRPNGRYSGGRGALWPCCGGFGRRALQHAEPGQSNYRHATRGKTGAFAPS